MNKEETKKAIEIMQAFVNGEVVQTRYKDRNAYSDSWFDTPNPRFNFETDDLEYRIKQEPFECWVNIYSENSMYSYESELEAKNCSGTSAVRCAVHMREVEE